MIFVSIRRNRLLFYVLLGSAVVIGACGSAERRILPSPDGRYKLTIEQRATSDFQIRIVLIGDRRQVTIVNPDSDWKLGPTEAYWAPDSSIVGVYACNLYGGRRWGGKVFGYNLRTFQPVAEELVRPALAELLRKRYSIPTDADPLQWACSSEGNEAYETRHARGEK